MGAAARALRDRRRLEVVEQGGAQAWIKTLLSAKGQAALKDAGFLPLPEGVVVDRLFRAALVLATGVALAFLLLPDRRGLPPRAAGRARLGARKRRGAATRSRHGRDERDRDGADPPLRDAGRVLDRDAARRRSATSWSRSSSFRSCCRPRSPASACSPRSAALGLLGGTIDALGIDIAFTKAAVVLAVTFVASPFYVRTAVAAFEAVDPTLPAAARTLGAGPRPRLLRVIALPLARGGLGAGAALAFARGIGEFGATIMFAGSLQGVTQTLSLAIYEQFDVDFDVALAISARPDRRSAHSSSSPSSSSPDGAPGRLHPSPSQLRRVASS